MGNEFKVMEMNVLFEVQGALTELTLSLPDKHMRRRCHMVPSPQLNWTGGPGSSSLPARHWLCGADPFSCHCDVPCELSYLELSMAR